jgi:probable rRNA maturation factor
MTVAVSNRQRLLKVNTRQLKKLAEAALELLGVGNHRLSIVLVNDETITKLNKVYHRTEGPTDVLSFDYGEGQGELVISVERAVAQAKQFRSAPGRELALCIVHGILHLHGHGDRTAPQRRQMRAAERLMLTRLRRRFAFESLLSS